MTLVGCTYQQSRWSHRLKFKELFSMVKTKGLALTCWIIQRLCVNISFSWETLSLESLHMIQMLLCVASVTVTMT
jgi:hypothetical protein